MRYVLPAEIKYRSERYGKTITVPAGYISDGASGATDIYSNAWFVHDWICGNYLDAGPKPDGAMWDDGTAINNWQASTILCDILRSEGRWIRGIGWWLPTWLFGGGKCRDNGMFP
jgi:hypothetical protein